MSSNLGLHAPTLFRCESHCSSPVFLPPSPLLSLPCWYLGGTLISAKFSGELHPLDRILVPAAEGTAGSAGARIGHDEGYPGARLPFGRWAGPGGAPTDRGRDTVHANVSL